MIVVDTHIILWNALKPKMLSRKAKKAIVSPGHAVRSEIYPVGSENRTGTHLTGIDPEDRTGAVYPVQSRRAI